MRAALRAGRKNLIAYSFRLARRPMQRTLKSVAKLTKSGECFAKKGNKRWLLCEPHGTTPSPESDDLGHYLALMVSHGASDLFLSSGAPASLKIQGQLRRLPEAPLGATRIKALAYSVMRDTQVRKFECDLAIALDPLGRFRINVYRQRGDVAVVVPAVEVMLLSPYIADLIQKGKTDEIKAAMAQSVESGMATFDQSLYELYTRGDISQEQAIEQADSKTDLSLRIRLTSARQAAPDMLHVLRD